MSALAEGIQIRERSLTPGRQRRTMGTESENGNYSTQTPGRAGDASPSTVCAQRRLSPALVTTPERQHDYTAGRPTIVLPSLEKQAPKSEVRPRRPVKKTSKPSFRRMNTAPASTVPKLFLSDPPPLRLEAWTEPPASTFKVRGPTYLKNNKKVPSADSAFRLLTVDLIKSDKAQLGGYCSHPHERIQKALRREKETGVKELPEFVFAVNLAVPGPPYYNLVCYFGVEKLDTIQKGDTPFSRVAKKFFFGDSDSFRKETFKLIPRIPEGNFVVKKAVGTKPSILGNKLDIIFVRNERFLELIVDIGSEPIAQKIVKLSIGYARTLVVDMAFLLESREEAHLPEQLMGVVRLINLEFKKKDGQRVIASPS